MTPTLYVYSRRGCHLCEVLVEALLPMVRGRLDVEVRDVDTHDDWRVRYGPRVPLVEFEGKVICEYQLDRPAIEAVLARYP